MKQITHLSRRDILRNAGAVVAASSFATSDAAFGNSASPRAPQASKQRRVLVLMGDRYHNQANIRGSLHPVFTELQLRVDYTTNYYELSTDLLKPYQLFVCFRDNAIWPGGYLGSDEDPLGGRGVADGLENREDFPSEKSENWITEEQGHAVQDFVSAGNGFLSLHCSSLISQSSKNFRDVQGGVALGHTPVRYFKVRIVNKEHPITDGVADFMINDEQQYTTYDKDPRNLLLQAENLDGLTFDPTTPRAGRAGGRGGRGFLNLPSTETGTPSAGNLGTTSAVGWAHEYGQGRVAFLAMGHTPQSMNVPEYIKLQKNAIRWLLKQT